MHCYRTMYWTDWGDAAGIYKSCMDGADVVKLNEQVALRPRSITVDNKASRLYWVNDEGIWLSDLEGQGALRLTGNKHLTSAYHFSNSFQFQIT